MFPAPNEAQKQMIWPRGFPGEPGIPGDTVGLDRKEVSLERAPPRGAGAQGRPGVPGGVGTLRKTFQQTILHPQHG